MASGGNATEVENGEEVLAVESRRLRELFKYFRASYAGDPTDPDSYTSYKDTVARLSSDPALTAFAQLGALRLDCDRAFISLIDSHDQHIIAEASRSISLFDVDRHRPGDAICLGARPLDLFAGVCAGTMKVFTSKDDRHDISTANIVADRTRYIINDFTLEEMYKHRPYVTDFPHMRFYAEVPLKSPSGYVLGSYCVVDNKPRPGLDREGILTLTEIADTIMKHLELVKMKEDHARAEALLRGLDYFVQGNRNLRDWQPGLATEENERRPSPTNSVPDKLADIKSDLQPELEDQTPEAAIHGRFAQLPVDGMGFVRKISSTSDSATSANFSMISTTPPVQSTAQSSYMHSKNGKVLVDPSNTIEPAVLDLPVFTQSKSEDDDIGVRLRELAKSDDIRENFSRASEILRKSMDLEGVVFLDASSGRFGSRRITRMNQGRSATLQTTSPVTSEDEGQRPAVAAAQMASEQSTTSRSNPGNTRNSGSAAPGHEPEKVMSGLLGYSVRQRSSLGSNSVWHHKFLLPEDIHQRLLKNYPRGHVFNLDGGESGLSANEQHSADVRSDAFDVGTTEEDPTLRKQARKRRQEEMAIVRCFPGVRSLIFVPLWNPHKETWFAGSLGWTADQTRVLQPREFTFFSTFGNSIMAEVTRLELLATDRAKSDFISSISHELRSPLHGILGSAEILREKCLGADQIEMIQIIDNCGRTLLDTMDHLYYLSNPSGNIANHIDRLDFAKINNLKLNKHKGKRNNMVSSEGHRELDGPGSKPPFDLSVLIEDLAEGVVAGYRFHSRSLSRKPGDQDMAGQSYAALVEDAPTGPYGNAPMEPLSVILSVDKRATWQVYSDAGAWRRILVNLLGNALKYTSCGFVQIAVQGTEAAITVDGASIQGMVTVCISDTGCGIGQEYLKNHLYTPFAQENALANGTGLGLSIVKQIATSLNGSIDIQSEVGTGTEVTVSIPVCFSKNADSEMQQYNEITVCLLGFDEYPELDTAPTGILSAQSRLAIALKAALDQQAKQWFGVRVVTAQVDIPEDVNVVIIREETLHIIQVDDAHGGKELQFPDHLSVIVLSSNIFAENQSRWENTKGVEFLVQPLGPQKLAKALKACMHRCNKHTSKERELVARPAVGEPDLPPTFVSSTSPANESQFQRTSEEDNRTVQSPSEITNEATLQQVLDGSLRQILAKPNLLLVDDNHINLKILTTYTEKLECRYTTAENGQQAFEVYKKTKVPFDYVFMDLSMPVMDGLAATREIRAFEKANGLPPTKVIALTGLGSAQAQQEAFASGVNLFLTKPVPMKKVKAVIDGVMDPDTA